MLWSKQWSYFWIASPRKWQLSLISVSRSSWRWQVGRRAFQHRELKWERNACVPRTVRWPARRGPLGHSRHIISLSREGHRLPCFLVSSGTVWSHLSETKTQRPNPYRQEWSQGLSEARKLALATWRDRKHGGRRWAIPNRTSGTSQVQKETSKLCAEITNRLGWLPRLERQWMEVK